jgi:hypothetical protein
MDAVATAGLVNLASRAMKGLATHPNWSGLHPNLG